MSDAVQRQPQFSIVIPVHNGANYLAHTLNSLFTQTYPHFNVIVLENASTDDTVAILHQYAEHEPRLKVLPSTTLLPIEQNWARILGLDLNEFMTTVCHDDPLYPTFLEHMAALIQAEPGATLYHAHFDFIDDEGKLFKRCHPVPLRQMVDEFLHTIHTFQQDFPGSGYVMRSADYKHVGGLPPFPRLLFADLCCWQRLTRLGYKVCSPKTLNTFRVHTDSVTSQSALWDFYRAERAYYQALQADSAFAVPTHEAEARHFLAVFFDSRHRMALHQAVHSSDPGIRQAYRELRARLRHEAAQDKLFAVENGATRVYAQVAALPSPHLRQGVYRALKLALNLKRRFRGGDALGWSDRV